MPLPKTTNVGTIMKELKTGKKRPLKQRVAISLSHARKMGANIPEKTATRVRPSHRMRIKNAVKSGFKPRTKV